LEKKEKQFWKKKIKKQKKEGKLEKKMQKKKTLWITVIIHNNLDVGEQWFLPHHLDIVN